METVKIMISKNMMENNWGRSINVDSAGKYPGKRREFG